MKDKIHILCLSLFIISLPQLEGQTVYDLWHASEKPHYKENDLVEYEKELWGTTCVLNITEPSLTIYPAKGENSGRAVIIVPGGGYELVAMYHEGYDVAEAISSQGITAAVLKYRLPYTESSDEPGLVPLADTRKALKIMHEKARDLGIDKDQIGLLGFSAGSHLSAAASVWKSKDEDENPNFVALIYGVTILSEDNLNWLEKSLYHRPLTAEEIYQNKLIDRVTDSTPPAFIVHAYDDDVCPVEESTWFAQALREHEVKVEMHLFSKGGHGFGLGREEDGTDKWVNLFVSWLKKNEFQAGIQP